MPLLIACLAGVFILVGALLTHVSKDSHKIEAVSFALALGALVSLMIFDLVPDIIEGITEGGSSIWLCIIFVFVGFGLLVLLDLFTPDHDDHKDTPENHDNENSAHIGIMSALAVILHNIIEGMTVYTLAMSSAQQGAILAISIGLHNIPMGMLIYSTLSHKSRFSKWFLTALVIISTPLGGILMMLMSSLLTEALISALVSIAAGMIVYLIFMELLPHVIKTRPVKFSLIGVVIGFLAVLLSTILG